jgi:predicted nucleic acid-binding protein
VIVVDASVVVDHLVGRDERLVGAVTGRMHAPHVIDHEVLSVLRRYARRREVSEARIIDALTDYDGFGVVRWTAGADLRRRAFELRDNLTAYDAAYVVLAEALDCPLVTRDRRLADAAGHLVAVQVL